MQIIDFFKAGAMSHAICLYAHDTETQAQFFLYGFGIRGVVGLKQKKKDKVLKYIEYAKDCGTLKDS